MEKVMDDEREPDYWDEHGNPVYPCHYCDGDGFGMVGLDWDSDDPINGPYVGDIQECPCCHGSGKAEDCTFW